MARSLGVNEERLGRAVWYLRATRELGVDEKWLRNLMERASDEERKWRAAELATTLGSEPVARITGISVETLFRYAGKLGDQQYRAEHIRYGFTIYLEEGPS